MKKISIAIAVFSLILSVGCQNKNQSASQSNTSEYGQSATVAQNLTPEQLGELGAQIKKHPNEAQKLLSEKGLTQQSFEQAVRKVAENPDESKRYAAAYKKNV